MVELWERLPPSSFGGESVVSQCDVNLIDQHFGSNPFHEMERLIQAVRHGVPVNVVMRGNMDAETQYGNYSSAFQYSDSLVARLTEDVGSGGVFPLHRSIARTVHGLRVSPLTVAQQRNDQKRE